MNLHDYFFKNKKKFIIYSIILSSFFLSIFVSNFYLEKYDKYEAFQNNDHPMLKIAVNNHWSEANQIIQDFKLNKNFFKSGKVNEDEFLPQKILALYYLSNEQNMYNKKFVEINNGKFLYLSIKSFFYFFFIFLFYQKYTSYFGDKFLVPIILFLCIFPDIFQYQISFWNESYTLIFILILSLQIIKFEKKSLKNFFLGITAALPYLTGQEYIFYIFVFIFYYIFIFLYYKLNVLKYILSFVLGYSLILLSVSLINSKKTEEKNLNVYGLKSALYLYVVPKIISENDGISTKKAKQIMKNDALNWAQEQEIEYLDENKFMLKISEIKRNQLNEYQNYMLKYSIKKIFSNLDDAIVFYFKKTSHMMVLNPFFVDKFYKYESIGNYLKSDEHKNLIKYRILYSIIFIFFISIGFYKSLKIYEPETIFLLSSLILYNIIILGFLGTPRYFLPTLIYISFFIGPIFSNTKMIMIK